MAPCSPIQFQLPSIHDQSCFICLPSYFPTPNYLEENPEPHTIPSVNIQYIAIQGKNSEKYHILCHFKEINNNSLVLSNQAVIKFLIVLSMS